MSFHNQNEFDRTNGRLRKKRKGGESKCSPTDFVYSFFPCIDMFKRYQKSYILGDVIAGFTVAAFNIPHGMANASLAGMPPVIGLYMSFVAPLIYFIFGTSNHLSVPTIAPVCMMVGLSVDSINNLIDEGRALSTNATTGEVIRPSVKTQEEIEDQLIAIAASIGLCSGIFLLALGLLRLGFVGGYFSVSLVRGLTFGVVFHVSTSQLIRIFGLTIEKCVDVGCLIFTWRDIILNISKTNICSLVFGMCAAIVLYVSLFLLEKFKSKLKGVPVPMELILVIGATMISHFANFHDKYGLDVIGDVPTGFRLPSINQITILVDNPSIVGNLISSSIPIALVSFAISLALAKILAQKHNYAIHDSQELVALGFVDTIASFFGCLPSAASPSRTNLQSDVGGKTQIAGLITSGVILVVMVWAGPLMYSCPYTVLGAIIIIALRSFFKQALELPSLYRSAKYDFVCWVLTALFTILINITYGLICGIVLSLFSVLWRSQRPHFFQLGQVVGTNHYRDISSYENIKKIPQTIIFRFNMSLYFANVDRFLSSIKKEISQRHIECGSHSSRNHHSSMNDCVTSSITPKREDDSKLRFLILDGEPLNFIDHSGVIALVTVLQYCKSLEIQFLITCAELETVEKFEREGFVDKIGAEKLFPSVHDAVLYVEHVLANGEEGTHSFLSLN
ncbi:sulfate transporter-like [Convolutriloba macropyga]|uniref:sulfate transporter-like n=1 Tax=Convolutriloba macropyga TaxID=536237 RepID=UPI003F51BC56